MPPKVLTVSEAPAACAGQEDDHAVFQRDQPLQPGADFGEGHVFVADAERLHHRGAGQVGRQRRLDSGDQHLAEDGGVGHRQRGQPDAERALRVVEFIVAPRFPEFIELCDHRGRNRIPGGGELGEQGVESFFRGFFEG